MLVRTKFNSQRKPSWGKNRLYLNHQVDWKQTAKSYNAIRAIFSVFRMYSTEFDSGCLVCFIEIISCADPQWEIPLYVWLKISALSRSSSCFRPAHPSWSRDLHEYPGLFLGEYPRTKLGRTSRFTHATPFQEQSPAHTQTKEIFIKKSKMRTTVPVLCEVVSQTFRAQDRCKVCIRLWSEN